MPSGTSSSCAISFRRPRSSATGDLARNAATARSVRHQNRIAAGERQVGRQRRAFGAALFLDDLNQHHLPALDDFLDFVLAPEARHPLLHFFKRVSATDGFDGFVFVVLIAVAVAIGRFGRRAFRGQCTFSGGGRLFAFRDGFERCFACFRCSRRRVEVFFRVPMNRRFVGVFFGGEIRRRRFGFRQGGLSFLRRAPESGSANDVSPAGVSAASGADPSAASGSLCTTSRSRWRPALRWR